jgi:hypothetical protein
MTQADTLVIPESRGGEMIWNTPESTPPATTEPEKAPEAPAVAPTPEPTQPPAEPEKPAEQPTTEPVQDEGDAVLLQLLDTDPELAAAYYTRKYGQATQAAPLPPPVQIPEAPPLPFEQDQFDPTDATHLMGLFEQVAYKMNAPLYQYVQQLQEQDLQSQQSLAVQQVSSLEQNIHKMMDAFVPGVGDWASAVTNGGKVSEQQELVASHALTLFTREMKRYPEEMRGATQLHHAVISKIGPKVKAFADAVGLGRTGDPVARADMHVQPSGAVPAPQTAKTMFDAAMQSGDETKRINALFEALHARNRS